MKGKEMIPMGEIDPTVETVDQRVALYGDPVQTFVRIAEVWSGIIGHHINPTDVPLMLTGMKLVRTQVTPDYSDNSEDVLGYMKIFTTLVGEDMVHARTPDAYWAGKDVRDSRRLKAELGSLANDLLVPATPGRRTEGEHPVCRHCREEEVFHDPITRSCVRAGFTSNVWTES